MTIDKHPKSRYFRCLYIDATGKRVCRSLKTTDPKLAAKMGADLEIAARQARAGTFSTDRGRDLVNQLLTASGNSTLDQYTTRQFFDRWMGTKSRTRAKNTAIRYSSSVKGFLDTLGELADKPLSAVQVRHVEDFRNSLSDKGCSTNSLRLDIKILMMVFRQAIREGLITTNPAAAVELDDAVGADKEAFTADDVAAMLRVAPLDWKTAILLGAYSGMRLGDAVNLTWKAVDFTKEEIRFIPQKTSRKKKEVTVSIHPTLAAHLNAIAGDIGGPLCPTLAGRKSGGSQGLSRQFIVVMEGAGIDREASKRTENQPRNFSAKSFHSLRHFFNSALLNSGVDERVRMELSGHTTAAINRKYSHTSAKTRKEAIDKI